MATVTEDRPGTAARRQDPERPGDLRELAKFTALVALFAIFVDAAVGHGLLWENDPYWTYWVTKTALIATVFGLGTAWLGMGLARGAAITAIHTVVLTVYYWSLSPIGLPSHPEWLDLEHTWVTGVPVHFAVIYLGYLGSLWLWRRRDHVRRVIRAEAGGTSDVGSSAGRALGVAVAIVVVAGGLSSIATGRFPGATWFLVRLLITVPFIIGWWAVAGRDRAAGVAGALVLAFMWATYGHFLGPEGLPDVPLRIFEQAAPGATVEWLSYRDLWLVSLPIYFAVSLVVLLAVAQEPAMERAGGRAPLVVGLVGALVVAAAGVYAFGVVDPTGDAAAVAATGTARVEQGPWFGGKLQPTTATLEVRVVERNPRVTPLPPHDTVHLRAVIEHPNGTTYEVLADDPMVEDPAGRHGTWWGVGLHKWHHGRSGIGSDAVPAVYSELAVFATGRVLADGQVVATGVPIHAMTIDKGSADGRLELDVGRDHPLIAIPAIADGHLRVVWDTYTGGVPHTGKRARNVFGTATLLVLIVIAIADVRGQRA